MSNALSPRRESLVANLSYFGEFLLNVSYLRYSTEAISLAEFRANPPIFDNVIVQFLEPSGWHMYDWTYVLVALCIHGCIFRLLALFWLMYGSDFHKGVQTICDRMKLIFSQSGIGFEEIAPTDELREEKENQKRPLSPPPALETSPVLQEEEGAPSSFMKKSEPNLKEKENSDTRGSMGVDLELDPSMDRSERHSKEKEISDLKETSETSDLKENSENSDLKENDSKESSDLKDKEHSENLDSDFKDKENPNSDPKDNSGTWLLDHGAQSIKKYEQHAGSGNIV